MNSTPDGRDGPDSTSKGTAGTFGAARSVLRSGPENLRPTFLDEVGNAKRVTYGIAAAGVICAVLLARQVLSADGSTVVALVALTGVVVLAGMALAVMAVPTKYHDSAVSPVAMLLMLGFSSDEARHVIMKVRNRDEVVLACKFALNESKASGPASNEGPSDV